MPTVDVFADKTRRDTCAGCGAPIKFAQVVKSSKWMPFQVGAEPVSTSTDALTGRRVATVDLAMSHFADCPQAKRFSKKKKAGADATTTGR